MSFTGSTFGRFTRTYFLIMGGFFVIVGIGLIVALGNIPFAGPGIWLTGGIFALVGGGLVVAGLIIGRRASATDVVLASGHSGTASITGVTQTGMYLNEQPQIKMGLLVTLPGQQPYPAEHTEFVPMILLARVQPGATLPVRVNPIDPSKVAIDWQRSTNSTLMPAASGSGMDESLGQVQQALGGGAADVPQTFATPDQANYTIDQLRAWLRANGIEAQARIEFLEDSGKIVGDERLYTMEMTLMVPGSSPEKLTRSAAMVPLTAMPKLQQGMTIPVKVAAENHQLLTVEWDRL